MLNAGGRLAETLAATSAGMTVLSRIKDKLRAEADELFSPRRSGNKPFYGALDHRENADKKLRDAIVTRETVEELQNAVEQARERSDTLTREHVQSGTRLALLQRTLRVRSKLARIESVAEELVQYAGLPQVASLTLREWRSTLEAEIDIAHRIAALDAADAADAQASTATAVDESLLSEGPTIDALREQLGAVRKAKEDIPRRRQAREAANLP